MFLLFQDKFNNWPVAVSQRTPGMEFAMKSVKRKLCCGSRLASSAWMNFVRRSVQAGHGQFETEVIQMIAIEHACTAPGGTEPQRHHVRVNLAGFDMSVTIGVVIYDNESAVHVFAFQLVLQGKNRIAILTGWHGDVSYEPAGPSWPLGWFIDQRNQVAGRFLRIQVMHEALAASCIIFVVFPAS